MKGSIALIAVPVLAGPAVVTAGAAAYAAPPPVAELRMTYGTPEVTADNTGVTWRWTLANAGNAAGEEVVATHTVSADQAIVAVSQPCASTGTGVVCRFGEIKPGERRSGWIRTSIGRTAATLRVSAQVTWHENIPPRVGKPSVADAGIPAAAPATPTANAGHPATGTPATGAAAPATGTGTTTGPATGTSGDESWGVADTDVATDVPRHHG